MKNDIRASWDGGGFRLLASCGTRSGLQRFVPSCRPQAYLSAFARSSSDSCSACSCCHHCLSMKRPGNRFIMSFPEYVCICMRLSNLLHNQAGKHQEDKSSARREKSNTSGRRWTRYLILTIQELDRIQTNSAHVVVRDVMGTGCPDVTFHTNLRVGGSFLPVDSVIVHSICVQPQRMVCIDAYCAYDVRLGLPGPVHARRGDRHRCPLRHLRGQVRLTTGAF